MLCFFDWLPRPKLRTVVVTIVVGLLCHGASALHAEEAVRAPADLPEEHASQRSIADELAEGVVLLTRELAKQQQNLQAAQTDRERQLIQDHIAFLTKQRRSLTDLLDLLVGPHFDTREAAREQRQELQYERTQRQLEQDSRPAAQ